jgi:hypothetical protein
MCRIWPGCVVCKDVGERARLGRVLVWPVVAEFQTASCHLKKVNCMERSGACLTSDLLTNRGVQFARDLLDLLGAAWQ